MKLLLDTCTFLWLAALESKLSAKAREALEDGRNTLVLSQVSSWELQIKHQNGQLGLADTPANFVAEGLRLHDIQYAPLSDAAIWHLQKLPSHHKDPFDRMLIATALTGSMQIVTPDQQIHRYPLPVIW